MLWKHGQCRKLSYQKLLKGGFFFFGHLYSFVLKEKYVKKRFLALIFVFAPILAFGDTVNNSGISSQEKLCRSYLNTAKNIMTARQSGKTLTRALQEIDFVNAKEKKAGTFNQKAADIFQNMVIDAYEKPKFSTREYQVEEINEFSEKYYIHCKKNMF